VLEWTFSVANFSPATGARNQEGIWLSYRPASLCSLPTQFQTRFLESIPRPIAGLKFSNQCGCGPALLQNQNITLFPYLWTGVLEREFTRSLLRNRVSFSVENCNSEPQKVREYIHLMRL
jgi:hypothetical protein